MMKNERAVTFGELLLRLSPEKYLRLVQSDRYEATFGGAEANVAVNLARYGFKASFVTKLPEHELGQAALDCVRRYGVDTSAVVRGGERVGIYYLEKGISERGSKVIYDRKHSSFAEAEPSDFDWEKIFEGRGWFHLTGITPALSENTEAISSEAVKRAKAQGWIVSFDPNYRSGLWGKKRAGETLRKMSGYADVLITNMGQAEDVYGIADETEEETAKLLASEYGCRYVALTRRKTHTALKQEYGGMLWTKGQGYRSRTHELEVADRVGAGDAFAAGLIYALSNGYEPQRAIEFAAAAGSLKHTVEGDFNLVSLRETEALALGKPAGGLDR